MSRALVVVPCFDEAARLDREAFLAFAREEHGHRLLLVDDGSRDATWEVLRDLARQAPDRIGAMRLPRNRGKAEAVRQGLLAAMAEDVDYVGYWDADLATPLDAIPYFCAYMDARPQLDAVLGSRVQLLGRIIERHALRHYVGRIFGTAASMVLGLPVYDTQCGAKMLRPGPATRPLFEEPFLANWSFDVEWLARYVSAHGHEHAQAHLHELTLPVWRDVRGSKVRPWDLFTALLELWRIHRRHGARMRK